MVLLWFFKYFKGCLPQILLGPFLNTFSHMIYVQDKNVIKDDPLLHAIFIILANLF